MASHYYYVLKVSLFYQFTQVISKDQDVSESLTVSALDKTQEFWRDFYANSIASGKLRGEPSPFAKWCLENNFTNNSRILEFGCGNGRDSFAFMHNGLPILAIDGSEIAIRDNIFHLESNPCSAEVCFTAIDFSHLDVLMEHYRETLTKVNTVYSRFVLHAIPEKIEDDILKFVTNLLPSGSRMWHEFRTINDPLMKEGKTLSETERFTDHYRRFLDADRFREKLSDLGWEEIYFIESNGLAKYKEQNPVVARVGAIRK